MKVKFKAFKDYEIKDINRAASCYNEEFKQAGLAGKIVLPEIKDGYLSSWAQYTIQLSECIDRAALQTKLKVDGIPSMVYYMKPMHKQGAYEGTDSVIADCPVTEKLCKTVLSLPLHPYMEAKDITFIVEKIKAALN